MIELVIDNYDSGEHPIHFHGRRMYVMARGQENSGPYNNASYPPNIADPILRDTISVAANSSIGQSVDHKNLHFLLAHRLTVSVFFSSALHFILPQCTRLFLQPTDTQSTRLSPLSSPLFFLISHTVIFLANFCATVVRFAESNPGIWMMHCHINWHQVRIKPTQHNCY